mmetsp:Transcript_32663/g.91465  ORF Transcript_32663/g.91465 Transcript_32663/m.91465 type:complete len:223 (+) Transcript_32663:97-765(+)
MRAVGVCQLGRRPHPHAARAVAPVHHFLGPARRGCGGTHSHGRGLDAGPARAGGQRRERHCPARRRVRSARGGLLRVREPRAGGGGHRHHPDGVRPEADCPPAGCQAMPYQARLPVLAQPGPVVLHLVRGRPRPAQRGGPQPEVSAHVRLPDRAGQPPRTVQFCPLAGVVRALSQARYLPVYRAQRSDPLGASRVARGVPRTQGAAPRRTSWRVLLWPSGPL